MTKKTEKKKQDVIKFEDNEKYVEGKVKMSYGFKKKMANQQRPSKMRYKGDNDIIMYLDDYEPNQDIDLIILKKQLTDWSKDDSITLNNIMEDTELGDLFDQFLDKVKEINNLNKVEKEKKQKEKEG